MKNTTFLFFVLLYLGIATRTTAQVNLLKAEEHVIEANINLVKDELSEINSNSKAVIELKNGELDIAFPIKRNSVEQFYNISLVISIDGEEIVPKVEEMKGFYGSKLIAEVEGMKKITWMRMIDTYKQLDGKLRIKINVDLRGVLKTNIDCDNPPTFTRKQKMPYLIAAGAGLLSIGVGQILKDRSQETYDEDYLTSSSLEESKPIYKEANNNHHAYLVLTYVGTAVLVTDVIWYIIRNKQYKKRLKIHKRFCNGNEVTVRPLIQLPTHTTNASSGFQLVATF